MLNNHALLTNEVDINRDIVNKVGVKYGYINLIKDKPAALVVDANNLIAHIFAMYLIFGAKHKTCQENWLPYRKDCRKPGNLGYTHSL